MLKRKKRKSRSAPLVQFGAARDQVKVLASLERRLEQALTMGRDAPAQELAREIGKLGGVNGVTITNSTFTG
jgi:hypothetical protein